MAWRGLPEPKAMRAERALGPVVPPAFPDDAVAGLCVLASGSGGNCSVLVVRGSGEKPAHVALIDAGLSPSRTRKLLSVRGIPLHWVDDVVLTHLDRDHFHPGWRRARDCRATLRLHRRHLPRAEREMSLLQRNEPFEDGFEVGPVRASTVMLAHDSLGVAAFRFEIERGRERTELGFATDLGRATPALVEHLSGVPVLAIESNYCPELQAASARPAFLKQRIMGGAGHLSNQEAADAIHAIEPADHVVFLHLSRECNSPDLLGELHGGADYGWTISTQFEPTPWVWLRACETPGRPRLDRVIRRTVERQSSLFAPADGGA